MFKITHNFKSFDLLEKFSNDLETQILKKGLDATLNHIIVELKQELKFLVNEQIVAVEKEAKSAQVSKLSEEHQPLTAIRKSDAGIVNHLTNGLTDLAKFPTAKSFTQYGEANAIVGNHSKYLNTSNRITLRMTIDAGDTVETHLAKAKEFFKKALFILPDQSGKMNFYINPGIDISEHVKIKCSVMTGDGNTKPRKGMSPEERFNRDSDTKGYAEWTLKQEAVEAIRSSFLNITPVIDAIKDGNIELARTLIRSVDRNNSLVEIEKQLEKIDSKEGMPISTRAYLDTIKLINNLKFSKKYTGNYTAYSLVSFFDELETEDVDLYNNLTKTIKLWFGGKEPELVEVLIKKIDRLIERYK